MANPASSKPAPISPPQEPAVEQRARAFLAQARWRKARDELKPLVKLDRPRYLPLLIEANIGLAREMLGKGQTSEAQQVIKYLATIAPPEQVRALELEFTGKAAPAEESVAKIAAALAEPGVQLSDPERLRLADLLVVAFKPAPTDSPALAALAAEVRAVHEGLQAVAESRWERVSEILRSIPRRSVLSHWALFVKGLAAFHTGETGKAERCFRELPPESIPARAGRAFQLLMDGAGQYATSPHLSASDLDAACRLTRQPRGSGWLLRADQLWRAKKFADSYRTVRDAVSAFPSTGHDALAALGEFYFSVPHSMTEPERNGYLRVFDGMISRGKFKSSVEAMLTRRMFSLLDQDCAPAWNLRKDWETFLHHHEALVGHNARLASLAYGWLGEKLSMVRASSGFFQQRQELRDANGAVELLTRSIELDPNNLSSHLQLCAVYDALKRTSERNRLLDTMSARFPDDKKVLLLTAERCIERKAYVKGLDYLARARQLDSLDPRIPMLTLIAQRRLARQYFQQRRPDKARKIFESANAWLTDQPDDLHRSRWAALARHSLMEQLWGDAAQAESLLAEARSLAPRPEALLLFLHLGHRVYRKDRSGKSPFSTELGQALRAKPTVAAADHLLRIIAYWKEAPEPIPVHQEQQMARAFLEAARRHPFTRDEAIRVIEHVRDDFIFEPAIKALLKIILKSDPADPRFRLYQLDQRAWVLDPQGDRPQLESILEEAIRRHDDATTRIVRQRLKDLDRPPLPLPLPFPPPFGDDPDDDFDEGDDALIDAFGGPDMLPPDLAMENVEAMDELLEAFRTASNSTIRKMRKTRPKDMPEEVFDMLVEMARKNPGGSLPPLPPKPSPKSGQAPAPKPPAPLPDPNQLNLF